MIEVLLVKISLRQFFLLNLCIGIHESYKTKQLLLYVNPIT